MSLTDIQVGNFYISGNLIPRTGNLTLVGNLVPANGTLNIFGNVASGTTGTVNIVGNIQCTGDVIGFNTLSDGRLKDNVHQLDNCLSIINALKPINYTWKENIFNESKSGTEDVGMIAQDVELIAPLVTKKVVFEGVEYSTIRYEKLVPYLIGAIQELSLRL
jgi:hypothetical protein